MAKGQTVLIVDAETDFLEWAVKQLAALELRVLSATQADVAFNIFCREKPELVIVDTHLQPFSGMELLSRIRGRESNAFVPRSKTDSGRGRTLSFSPSINSTLGIGSL